MFANNTAFASFAVDDIDAARQFYGQTLGLPTSEPLPGLLGLRMGDGWSVLIYPKPDYRPATFTVLNFQVDDIDEAVDTLAGKGIIMEQYDYPKTDGKGIDRERNVAWFTDPAGNILSVVQAR
jgi:predicted enzyme related to lactoylglutathione lyase